MTGATPRMGVFDLECPHCHKRFKGELIAGHSPQHQGFKCPHCKLFVAYHGAAEEVAPE